MNKFCDSFSVDISLEKISENRYIHPITKYLHIKNSVVATEGVIKKPFSQVKPHIDPEVAKTLKIKDRQNVSVFISRESLAASTKTFNGLQLMREHYFPDIDDSQKLHEIGHTLNYVMDGENLKCEEIIVKDKKAKQLIDNGDLCGLSIGYFGDAAYNPGQYKGQDYLFEVTDIKGSHVAADKTGVQRNLKAKFADSTNYDFINNEDDLMETKKIDLLKSVILAAFASVFDKKPDEQALNPDGTTPGFADSTSADKPETPTVNVNGNSVDAHSHGASSQDAHTHQTNQITQPVANTTQEISPKAPLPDQTINEESEVQKMMTTMFSQLKEHVDQTVVIAVEKTLEKLNQAKVVVDKKTAELGTVAAKLFGTKYSNKLIFGDSKSYDEKLNIVLSNVENGSTMLDKSEDRKLGFLESLALKSEVKAPKANGFADSTSVDNADISNKSVNEHNLY